MITLKLSKILIITIYKTNKSYYKMKILFNKKFSISKITWKLINKIKINHYNKFKMKCFKRLINYIVETKKQIILKIK